MESNYYYILLDLLTIAGPLALSFDKKVHFYTYFKPVFLSIAIVGGFFIVWDIWYTSMGVWGFSPQYLMGLNIVNLPIEEVLFFVAIPYAGLFTYECVKQYLDLKWKPLSRLGVHLFLLLLTIPLIGLFSFNAYTLSVSTLLFLVTIICIRSNPDWLPNFWLAYLFIVVPFLLVNGALTGLFTADPVVWYDDNENVGLRVTTIPVEDFIYGYLLLFGCTWFFELFRNRTPAPANK